jgi:hypothetical protein
MVSQKSVLTLVFVSIFALSGFRTAEAQVLGGPPRFVSSSPNFTVYANQQEWAQQVSQLAEEYRVSLATHWLGQQLPRWSKPCILFVQDNPNALASGETNYTLINGAVINFKMTVRGTRERILDSVLPHEITHTILASHFAPFGRPVPRWADEGMCTTVEHSAERKKHDHLLIRFFNESKTLPFNVLFHLEDYPADPLPLYAQGYSLTSFLIAQGGEKGPQMFIRFLEAGMKTNDWIKATNDVYGYPLVGKLQTAWTAWVSNGGNDVAAYTAQARGFGSRSLIASLNQPRDPEGSVQPALALASGNAQGDNVRIAELTKSALEGSSGASTASFNKLLHPSSDSYYLEKLRSQQATEAGGRLSQETIGSPTGAGMQPDALTASQKNQFVPALPTTSIPNGATQHSVSQPRPLETIGGPRWR